MNTELTEVPRHFYRPAFFDVDDTLVLWDTSAYPELQDTMITVSNYGYDTTLIPHQKNINLLKKFAKLGYQVVVWSQTGADWAQAIVDELELGEYVTLVMTKPKFYIDDLDCKYWMGTRVWRDPEGTGRGENEWIDRNAEEILK